MVDPEELDIPEVIRELTPEAYANWKQHPVTRALHDFMRNAREAMKREHTEAWENGKPIDPSYDMKAQARVEQFGELLDLTVEDIHRPYGYVPEPSNVEKKEAKQNGY